MNRENKIKQFREKLKMTLRDFADMLEIDHAALWRIEKGKCNPSLGTIMKIKRIVQAQTPKRRIELEEIVKDYWLDSDI
jgi:DNA-binding XRE family transcriptional regulator